MQRNATVNSCNFALYTVYDFQIVSWRFSKLIDSAYWFTIRRIRIRIVPDFLWTYIRVYLPYKAVNTVQLTVKSLVFFKTKCRAITSLGHSVIHCYGTIRNGSPLPILPAWFSGSGEQLLIASNYNFVLIHTASFSFEIGYLRTLEYFSLPLLNARVECIIFVFLLENPFGGLRSTFSKDRARDGISAPKMISALFVIDCLWKWHV